MRVEVIATAADAPSRELPRERAQSARRVNLLRVCGVSAFFARLLVLGGVLRRPEWTVMVLMIARHTLAVVAASRSNAPDRPAPPMR